MAVNKKQLVPDKFETKKRSERGVFFKPATLYLDDGTTWVGLAPDWQTAAYPGEVVFNTGMTGYVESLTDPSYTNQILVFTYPLIGNYGVALADGESDRLQVSGVVMSELATQPNHARANQTLLDWLKSQQVPFLTNVDTRALTKHLRSRGTMQGYIGTKPQQRPAFSQRFVSVDRPIDYQVSSHKTVILVDCGAKDNILQSLLRLNVHVVRVPYDYDYTNDKYDAVLLSNGPGDPTDYSPTIAIARQVLAKDKPVFGICLGSQIMALAAGARTYKLPFGHRGHNQPCLEVGSGRCYVTSQNHGYAIDEATLPKGWRASFRNLNDNSVEGIEHSSKPFFSVQFHPEACPGPTDTAWLFERFYELL